MLVSKNLYEVSYINSCYKYTIAADNFEEAFSIATNYKKDICFGLHDSSKLIKIEDIDTTVKILIK